MVVIRINCIFIPDEFLQNINTTHPRTLKIPPHIVFGLLGVGFSVQSIVVDDCSDI